MAVKNFYKLNDGDREIFKLAKEDPSWFTDYYFRSENTGTWFRPIKPINGCSQDAQNILDRWMRAYNILVEEWEKQDRPDSFEMASNVYLVHFEDEDIPVFHQRHGLLFLDWQKELYHAKQPTRVVVGGFGSGKTWSELGAMLIRAAILPGFRGLCLAPYAIQANEIFKQAMLLMEDTLYKERFLVSSKTKPHHTLVIGNDLVGYENTIECLSIMDDEDKILTLTADCALLDQAERLDDLDRVIRNIRSRFRGQIRGRERLGYLTLLANSAENAMLWDRQEEAVTNPDSVFALSPSTYSNTYITYKQLVEFEKSFAKDEKSRQMYLFGGKPFGSGEHFSQETIETMHSKLLDDMMETGLKSGNPEYIKLEAPRVQTYRWELPPKENCEYLVVSDPGWSNPPERDSAVVLVWDITNFPEKPAHLQAFNWVFGDNSPEPWIQAHYDYVIKYRAQLRNAFDATGQQQAYDRFVWIFKEIMAQKMEFGGQKKFAYLNAAKVMAPKGLLKIPTIPAMFNQLARYRLPDTKVRQDIVAAMMMTAGWLEQMFYFDINSPTIEVEQDKASIYERYGRENEWIESAR